LLSADTGVPTTKKIIQNLTQQHTSGSLTEGTALHDALKKQLLAILAQQKNTYHNGRIFLLVGINGSGKTTFASKLAHHYVAAGKRVLMVAADTFRAAAPEQLAAWAAVTKADIVRGTEGQDPASVVFQGCEKFKKESYDILIIDTAGRLQTKTNLMNELAKIGRVITKQLPNESINTLLTIDSMLGQNSFEQAKLFQSCTTIDGIVLTKMDGTGKGGIIFAIVEELGIPIWYITFGEKSDQLKPFNAEQYVENLLQS
jgi:fused signal recognition particle receptor